MQPRIVFLGTGGDSIVVGKQSRASGGIVIEVGNSQLHLDPGPGTLTMAKLLGINVRNTTAVICTHNHLNHMNDADALVSALSHGGLDTNGVFIGSQSVISGTEDMTPGLSKFSHRMLEKVMSLSPGNKVGVNDVEIRAVPIKHTDPTAIGIKLFTPEFTMGYTSDTEYTTDMVADFKDSDILILNVVVPSGMTVKGQLSTDDAIKLVELTKPKLAIITHFGVKMLAADPLQEARIIQKATGVQTVAAKDGLVINPISYAANMRQKTLNIYSK